VTHVINANWHVKITLFYACFNNTDQKDLKNEIIVFYKAILTRQPSDRAKSNAIKLHDATINIAT